ncbi:hypothetical protein MGYG_06827 [Nannizzia gypsea CBS 118893]|uniref:Uncharacterized protein n=1 Tax=Arthroderma gypseum (strain ATCC MYA-4604 / CBS 118893) TaxID=535722 RepID=E4V1B3_ARTGP|nr:hypothetical protein MGYG_06827 [Nannizzia gypsea CBS 118893]EFR03828.1 hypothetical protein MGYG_06827 [Nannizzia gypsea CBS 118893]
MALGKNRPVMEFGERLEANRLLINLGYLLNNTLSGQRFQHRYECHFRLAFTSPLREGVLIVGAPGPARLPVNARRMLTAKDLNDIRLHWPRSIGIRILNCSPGSPPGTRSRPMFTSGEESNVEPQKQQKQEEVIVLDDDSDEAPVVDLTEEG